MLAQWIRRIRSVIVAATALAAVAALPSTASARPPNFDIVAGGPVGFGCYFGGVFPACEPFVYLITGTAPASGTYVGQSGTFSTREQATPINATQNSIDGHAVVTAGNGDQLFIHYTGISPAPVPDATGVGHLNDDLGFVIEGGTGRFTGATGSGRLTATGPVYYDARPTVVSSELRGTITLPAPAPDVAPPPGDSVFLCYSDSQTDPGVWDGKTATALFAQGYWQPVAFAGHVDGGTNVGTAASPYHLACNLAAGQTLTGQYTDDSGDALPASQAPVFGSYAVAK